MSALVLGVVLGQLASLSPPGYKGTLSVGDRTEARVHSNVNAPESVDLETIPTAVVNLTGRRSSYLIGYGPRLAWIDVNRKLTSTFVIMNTARFSATYWSKRLRLTLAVTGFVGRQTAAGLGITIPLNGVTAEGAAPVPQPGTGPSPPGQQPQPQVPPQPQPQQAVVSYYLPPSYPLYLGSLRASLTLTNVFSPRWTGSVSGFYQMAGGLDFDPFSQLAYPPARGGGGEIVATYTMSKRDSLFSRLYSEYVYVLTTTDKFVVATYLETYRHAFTKRTTGTVGAGVSLVVRDLARQTALSGAVAGAGEATLTHVAPLRGRGDVALRAAANLSQGYNPILATVQWNARGTLSSTWSSYPTSVGVAVTAASSLPFRESDASRVGTGSLTIGYNVTEAVTLQTGIRAYAQLLPSDISATYPAQWVAFAALLLAAPVAKF